jgi:hypothetical protein
MGVVPSGGRRVARWPPLSLPSFFFFFFFKKSLFIYLLINLYFFIKMDTWRWRVGLTDSVKLVDGKSTQGVKCNYCNSQGPPMHFLNHKE